MRSGSLTGLDLDVSSRIILEHDKGLAAAYWQDDEDGYVPRDRNEPPIESWFALTHEQQQERLRAEAARRLALRQDRGVYDDILGRPTISPDDERFLVDGVHDRHANDVTPRTLQREIKIVMGGGGSKSRGRKTVKPGMLEEKPMVGRAVGGNRYIDTVLFRGATRGQHAVYRDHPDVPSAVAAMLVAIYHGVRAGNAPPELDKTQIIAGNKTILLVLEDHDVARYYRSPYMRGVAMMALAECVQRFDGGRAARLDAQYAREAPAGVAA